MAELDSFPSDMSLSTLPAAFASPSSVFRDEKVKVPKSLSHYYEIAQRGHQTANSGHQTEDVKSKPNFTKKCRTKSYNYLQYMQRKYGSRYCENCDLGFYSLEEFECHLSSHSKCPYSNCEYVGSVDALNNHISYQHMFPEFSANIDSDSYRQARLKNFPTSESRLFKDELLKKRKERGELFGLGENKKRFRSNDKNFEPKNDQKKPKITNRTSERKKNTVDECSAEKTVDFVEKKYTKRRPSPFRGIGTDGIDGDELFPRKKVVEEPAEMFDDFDISDEEENLNASTKTSSVMNIGGLGALMNYGSDSEDESSDKEIEQVEDKSKCVSDIKVEQSSNVNQNKDRNIDEVRRKPRRNRSNKSLKPNGAGDSVSTELQKSSGKMKKTNCAANLDKNLEDIPITERASFDEERLANICAKNTYRKFSKKFRESLLSKLLKDQIEHERNVLLQCTRYIVKNSFFEQKK